MHSASILQRDQFFFIIVALLESLVAAATNAAAQDVDPGIAVEACISCHATGTLAQAADVNDPWDVHYVDLDPAGPETASGYRQLHLELTSVDVTGSQVVIEFTATDEEDTAVTNLFDADGRFGLARLMEGAEFGDPTDWHRELSSERFTETGGLFENLGGGDYRYTSVFDPTSVPIATGDTLLTVQMSAGDLAAGNGWCDFDADLGAPNDCTSPVTLTRDIVQTDNCNSCHGVTSDTKLSFHGGGRTEVEWCVSCHNPTGNTDMTLMIHKIHMGNQLTQPWRGYETVGYTRDLDNCLSCHGGGGVDEDNWKTKPHFQACESCHDDIDIANGVGHIQIESNSFCRNCHPADPPPGGVTPGIFPVSSSHQGVDRATEAGLYRGDDGYALSAAYDRDTDLITVDYSVTRDGQPMIIQSDPRWSTANGARLALQVAWSTEEYTNEGSGSTPAPAQPVSFDALDVGGDVMDLGGGNYRAEIDVSSFGFGNITVGLEGHPVADIAGDGVYSRIPVRDVWDTVNIELREDVEPRRQIIDMAKCNDCHDASGAGLSLHGDNRTSEDQVCALCHNPDATDIGQRPADPGTTPDGKREESVDMKRMIHGIHSGKDLENGLVIYGFMGSVHDYSAVGFIGNNKNCLTCHLPGTYSTDKAAETLASTIDTGADVTDPTDDLNISPIAAACSSCHDDVIARNHMLLGGASFQALDEDIHVPEPGVGFGLLAGYGALVALTRCRSRQRSGRQA
jgi:OmcA/MtrC family decaheme c-type cytochrome